MSLASDFRAPSDLIAILVSLLLAVPLGHAAQYSDIDCLRSIRASLQDPLNYLASWNFENISNGVICEFTGIECWNADENRVLNIQLGDMGLRGEFPMGVIGCGSMTGLNLSSNHIHGSIPANISKLIRFVTTLDLSSNQFSGEIPSDLSNCSYLNVLKLDDNQLVGRIPPEIGLLNRIKTFTVTRNRLSGPVPQFRNSIIPAESYAGNAGLCGKPLPRCRGGS